jgi:hypothetical protein
MRRLALTGALAVALSACARPDGDAQAARPVVTSSPIPESAESLGSDRLEQPRQSKVGFRSKRQLAGHFRKHGAEFGLITQDEYLALAQRLRDAKVGGNVLEIVRDDFIITRFNRETGAFIAFEPDGTIQTFFKPNLGESYFRRQGRRSAR